MSAYEPAFVTVRGTESGVGSIIRIRFGKRAPLDATYDNSMPNVSEEHRSHILRTCFSRNKRRLPHFLLVGGYTNDMDGHHRRARLFRKPLEAYCYSKRSPYGMLIFTDLAAKRKLDRTPKNRANLTETHSIARR
jgi:hypothetical protein